MFQKFCVFIAFASIIGVAGAADKIPQVVTSEVFYDSGQEEYSTEEEVVQEPSYEVYEEYEEYESAPVVQQEVPVWPLAGSEADVEIACGDLGCSGNDAKIVSKVGSGLVIENNIVTSGTGWTGGPNISNGIQIPAGFDYECANNAEMPLMRREMMEDDGGSVLAMSRSLRKNCNKSADSYAVFAQRAGFAAETSCNKTAEADTEVAVNEYVDDETSTPVQDQVRSWVVTNGQTLRQVLQSWCDKEGWDLVWTTSREYPIEASAVFKGRFVDVASALVRNFERATPIPYAKFYKGNRVIVISTAEE
ncbi:MAG: toxin co-regulated pilus biosynthesis Q family protein [Alphaproteobacteria bacterium]|nr:toxin co-regulated pilus biosynthesis Q family protein [Alphaproteobacteria bacterium]